MQQRRGDDQHDDVDGDHDHEGQTARADAEEKSYDIPDDAADQQEQSGGDDAAHQPANAEQADDAADRLDDDSGFAALARRW